MAILGVGRVAAGALKLDVGCQAGQLLADNQATVNLASRIADVAQPDALLARASLAAALPPERFKVAVFGAASLAGISEPVELIRIGFA
jgi:class 3 adenylate cyclase